MKNCKAVFSLLLSVLLLLGSFTTAGAQDIETVPLAENETRSLLLGEGDVCYLYFTPEATDTYMFRCLTYTGTSIVHADLYDGSFQLIQEDMSLMSGNAGIYTELTAGTQYYFKVGVQGLQKKLYYDFIVQRSDTYFEERFEGTQPQDLAVGDQLDIHFFANKTVFFKYDVTGYNEAEHGYDLVLGINSTGPLDVYYYTDYMAGVGVRPFSTAGVECPFYQKGTGYIGLRSRSGGDFHVVFLEKADYYNHFAPVFSLGQPIPTTVTYNDHRYFKFVPPETGVYVMTATNPYNNMYFLLTDASLEPFSNAVSSRQKYVRADLLTAGETYYYYPFKSGGYANEYGDHYSVMLESLDGFQARATALTQNEPAAAAPAPDGVFFRFTPETTDEYVFSCYLEKPLSFQLYNEDLTPYSWSYYCEHSVEHCAKLIAGKTYYYQLISEEDLQVVIRTRVDHVNAVAVNLTEGETAAAHTVTGRYLKFTADKTGLYMLETSAESKLSVVWYDINTGKKYSGMDGAQTKQGVYMYAGETKYFYLCNSLDLQSVAVTMTFNGEETTEPPTEPTTEPTTQPTTQPTSSSGGGSDQPQKQSFFQRIIQWFRDLFARLFH